VRFDIPGNFPLNHHSRFRLKICDQRTNPVHLPA
jgi:hypothetical protein